jgi:hypothetical protein
MLRDHSTGHFGSSYRFIETSANCHIASTTSELFVKSTVLDDQYESDMAAISNDRYVCVWNSKEQDGSGYGVLGQVVDLKS